jgi:hypothetical protein
VNMIDGITNNVLTLITELNSYAANLRAGVLLRVGAVC